MITLDVNTILGSKSHPYFRLGELDVCRKDARGFFGVDAVVAFEDGLGEADYWAVQFECGIRIAFQFFHFEERGTVFADFPSPQHVRRHLRLWNSLLTDVPIENQEPDRSAIIKKFAGQFPDLLELDRFQVWRQGDDGNQIPVGTSTDRSDAACWLAELLNHTITSRYTGSLIARKPFSSSAKFSHKN